MVYFETAGDNFAEWGSRRGMLWQMAWQGFCRGDLKQKLLGPDRIALQVIWNRCYREARYYLTKAILPVRFLRMHTMNGLLH